MAEIVKARDTSELDEPVVAIKRILPHLLEDEQYKAMFLDESRVLAQLDHASIIPAFEVGEIDGTPYIALEYVDGQDARNLFHELHERGQRVPVGIACYLVARVCEGLHYAHEHKDEHGHPLGIVHRDVSLQNILISYDGDVKLTDFGIAVSAENVARTDVGVVKGKFGYMSPEQVRGAVLDRRSDVFAVGICLYELLTGERLFSGESDYKAVERVRNADVERPSVLNRQVPSSLEQIVMKALAKQPADRFPSANDLRRALQQFLAETHEFVDREDLGSYLREVFAEQYAAEAPAATQQEDRAEEREEFSEPATGLAQFDHIEPVRSLALGAEHEHAAASRSLQAGHTLRLPSFQAPSGLSAQASASLAGGGSQRPVPSVPPIIPRPESIPGGAGFSPALRGGAGIESSWEDEPTTIAGSRHFGAAPEVRDDEPTRQMVTDDLAMSPNQPRPRSPLPAADHEPRMRSLPTLEIPSGRPVVGPVLLMSVFGLIALGLIIYMVRDHGAASLKLETEPTDALVRVDGKSVEGRASPFVLSDLESGANHTIVVEKPGYASWSTKLKVRAGKTLVLPLVRLEPLVSDEPAPKDLPLMAADAPSPPAPEKIAPDHAVRPKRPTGTAHPAEPRAAREPAPQPVVAREPAPPPTRPRTGSAPAAKGSGTLKLNTRPWSQISIDGKPAGNTPQINLQLSAGTHIVTVSNPDFGVSKTFQVEIKADETVTRVLTLTN
jgi:serine/threonine protein kinase